MNTSKKQFLCLSPCNSSCPCSPPSPRPWWAGGSWSRSWRTPGPSHLRRDCESFTWNRSFCELICNNPLKPLRGVWKQMVKKKWHNGSENSETHKKWHNLEKTVKKCYDLSINRIGHVQNLRSTAPLEAELWPFQKGNCQQIFTNFECSY